MRWMGGRRSDNIEDRRGMGGGTLIAGGGIGSIVLVLLALFFGFDPGAILQTDQPSVPRAQAPAGSPAQDDLREFVSVVLADTEDTWLELFNRMGRQYREPKLVLFTTAVESACGMAGAAVGPFYCPSDQKLYLDLSFFRALRDRFRAPGDFAQAYVIAHEVGHHVQTLLGLMPRGAAPQAGAEATSVRVELQADCLAGVWGYHANRTGRLLEPGDVDEGLRAAAAIGDDRLQRTAGQAVQPESWTHGSSQMRARWLRRGLETGDPAACDTFSAEQL